MIDDWKNQKNVNNIQNDYVWHSRRIQYQSFAADEQKLCETEVLEPAFQIPCIYTDFDWAPRCVDHTDRGIQKYQFVEFFHSDLFGGSLRIVGNGTCHRISNHHQQSEI